MDSKKSVRIGYFMFGKNILLYFFSCNPFPLVPQIRKVSEKYSNNDQLQIICIGRYLKNSSLPDIDWIQINNGSPQYHVRILYQVGALISRPFLFT